MLGQAPTPRRRLWPSAALVLAVLVVPAVGGATGAHNTRALHAQETSFASRSRAAVLSLYALDHRLASAHSRLGTLEQRESSLHARQLAVARELLVAERSMRVVQARVGRQVRTLYEAGNVEPLEIVFGSMTLDEAMTRIDNLNATAAVNRDLARGLKVAKSQFLRERRTLATQAVALDAARAAAAATAVALAQTRAERSAYIASLARERRLTAQRIAAIVVEAHAAQTRSARTNATRQPASPPVEMSSAAGTSLTVSATGYSLGGHTSSGLPVGFGVVAVDPSLIPLGTHMLVPGYGEAVAADTGSAIVGARIDLWFPTLAQARVWGRRTVTLTLR